MPRPGFILLFLISCCSLSACGSSATYRITLNDGREFIAASKPKFQSKTGYYRYKNFQGKDALIRGNEVLLIDKQG